MNQIQPLFIQSCKDKVYGQKIWININNIVSFEKYVKMIPDEQWYIIKTTNGELYFTTYDFNKLSIPNIVPS